MSERREDLSDADLTGLGKPVRSRTYTWVILVSAVATIGYLIVLATNVAPWVRGPQAWRWPYAIPGTFRRLWLPASLLVLYGALAWRLATRSERDPTWTRGAALAAIVVATAMTPAIQFALLYMDHPDPWSQLFYRTVSESANGFYNVGVVVLDRDDFMGHYADRMIDWYPTHPERHPPGLPVLFSLARQFYDARPELTARLNDVYRPYQCHNVDLMNLPDGAIAAASLQMVVPLLLSAVAPLLYLLGREVYDRATALRTVLLWPLVPGIALWAGFWTPLYTLFTVLVLLLLAVGLRRRRLHWFAWSGLAFSLSLFWTFGNATIVVFAGLYALLWWVQVRPRPRWHWLLGAALLYVLGTASFWLWLWFRHGLGFYAVWSTAIGKHFEMGGRSGWFWALYNLYDFYVAAAGIPILVLWALHSWRAIRDAWGERVLWARWGFWRRAGTGTAPRAGWLDALALSFAIGLLAIDLAGVARGEVARVWAYMLPLPLLVAARGLPRRGYAFLGTLALLSVQLFVTNVYVRYIGTDLSDPPTPPPVAGVSEGRTPWQASWEPGIALQAVDLPDAVSTGEPIAVGATWSAARRIRRPYTVFVHLYDGQGTLVAQRDTMPLDGGWPTPCWRPGEPFQDRYLLAPSQPLAPGRYRLELGLYWLPTGERLPVQGQGAQPHRTVHLGEIRVEAP